MGYNVTINLVDCRSSSPAKGIYDLLYRPDLIKLSSPLARHRRQSETDSRLGQEQLEITEKQLGEGVADVRGSTKEGKVSKEENYNKESKIQANKNVVSEQGQNTQTDNKHKSAMENILQNAYNKAILNKSGMEPNAELFRNEHYENKNAVKCTDTKIVNKCDKLENGHISVTEDYINPELRHSDYAVNINKSIKIQNNQSVTDQHSSHETKLNGRKGDVVDDQYKTRKNITVTKVWNEKQNKNKNFEKIECSVKSTNLNSLQEDTAQAIENATKNIEEVIKSLQNLKHTQNRRECWPRRKPNAITRIQYQSNSVTNSDRTNIHSTPKVYNKIESNDLPNIIRPDTIQRVGEYKSVIARNRCSQNTAMDQDHMTVPSPRKGGENTMGEYFDNLILLLDDVAEDLKG